MISPVLPNYARADIAFDHGDGPYLYTTDGRKILDFASGIAVTLLGHSHPKLVEAVRKQAGKLWHVSNLYRIPEQERVAERLVQHSFADTVFFCNSGGEAIECGIKMARAYHDVTGDPDRFRVIVFEGGFHGRTLAGISAGGQDKYLEGFGPKVDGFDRVAFGDLEAVRAAIGAETAAILIEPVQGESGIRVAPPAFLEGLRAFCDEHGLLLMFDEVQTGMGRTGTLFAYEWAGVVPDIMAVAKGLAGGFPVGACLATEAAAQGMGPGSHGSTFGGNPLAMAAAEAVLDVVLEEGFLERARDMANHLYQGLQGLKDQYPSVIEEVRAKGLHIGLKMKPANGSVIDALRARGMITVPAGDNVVRLLPPLVIDETHVAEALEILGKACAHLARETAEAAS